MNRDRRSSSSYTSSSRSRNRNRKAVWRRDLFVSKRKSDTSAVDESPSKYLVLTADSSDEESTKKIPRKVLSASNTPVTIQRPKKIQLETQAHICSDDSDSTDYEGSAASTNLEEHTPRKVLSASNTSVTTQHLKNIQPETQVFICSDDSDATQYEGSGTSSRLEEHTPRKSPQDEHNIVEFTTPVKDSASCSDIGSPEKTPVLVRASQRQAKDDIVEFISPPSSWAERRRAVSTEDSMTTCATQSTIDHADISEDEDREKGHAVKPVFDRRRRKKAKQIVPRKFLYYVADAPALALIVVRTAILDSRGVIEDLTAVWALCYDCGNECDRLVLLPENPEKKIKCGSCIKLLSPWSVSKVDMGDEIVLAIGSYQIVVPAVLGISNEMHRSIISRRSSPYTKFVKSLPAKKQEEVPLSFPWFSNNASSFTTLVSSFPETVNADVTVVSVSASENAILVLIRDLDSVLAVLEIADYYAVSGIEEGQRLRILNLGYSGRLSIDQLHSVLSSSRSPETQEVLVKFSWRPDTEIIMDPT